MQEAQHLLDPSGRQRVQLWHCSSHTLPWHIACVAFITCKARRAQSELQQRGTSAAHPAGQKSCATPAEPRASQGFPPGPGSVGAPGEEEATSSCHSPPCLWWRRPQTTPRSRRSAPRSPPSPLPYGLSLEKVGVEPQPGRPTPRPGPGPCKLPIPHSSPLLRWMLMTTPGWTLR